MAITAKPYGNFLLKLGTKVINVTTDPLKVLLTTSTYVPNQDTHQWLSDITGEVAAGGGYTTGGITLAGVTWTYDSTNKWAVLGASAVTWTAATFTARYAVIYDSTGTATTSPLIGYIDFGADKVYTGEDAQLTFPSGVLRVKAG